MVERRASVSQSFRVDDYARLKNLGLAVRGLGVYAALMGAFGVFGIVRSAGDAQPSVSMAVLVIVAVVWWGFSFFAFLVARDAIDATDTHVVLEVSASIAAGGAITFAYLLGLLRGFGAISAGTWQALAFAASWPVGYVIYAKLGEHFRQRFRLKRPLSAPPKWLIVVFTITVWIAVTALLENLVTSAVGDWRDNVFLMLAIVVPPVALAVGVYRLVCRKLESTSAANPHDITESPSGVDAPTSIES